MFANDGTMCFMKNEDQYLNIIQALFSMIPLFTLVLTAPARLKYLLFICKNLLLYEWT